MESTTNTLGPFKNIDDRAKEEAVNSVSRQIINIEDCIMKGNDYLEEYKKQVYQTKDQVDALMTRLMNRNEDVLNKLRPGIIEDYQNLKDKIKEQKDENEQLLKHLLGLKKEAASTQQKISLCQSRIQKLEVTLGIETPIPDMMLSQQHEQSMDEDY